MDDVTGEGMHVTQRSENRVQLESDKYQAAIRLTWDNEKKNSVLDNTTDTVETPKDNGNDTATPENAVSTNKDTTLRQNNNRLGEKVAAAEIKTNPTPAQAVIEEQG